jgi:hypothetical protein
MTSIAAQLWQQLLAEDCAIRIECGVCRRLLRCKELCEICNVLVRETRGICGHCHVSSLVILERVNLIDEILPRLTSQNRQ